MYQYFFGCDTLDHKQDGVVNLIFENKLPAVVDAVAAAGVNKKHLTIILCRVCLNRIVNGDLTTVTARTEERDSVVYWYSIQ